MNNWPWVSQQFKKKARIYILPTKMGGYLNGLIFLMFLLSVGYSNNLLLIFTLFLFGLNLIWVIQTHFHLHGLKLNDVQITDNHAESLTPVIVHWKKTPEGPLNWKLHLVNESTLSIQTFKDSSDHSEGHTIFPKRGVFHFHYLKVETQMPFGLYRAWIYFPVTITAHAYPAKLKDIGTMVTMPSQHEGETSTLMRGPHDVWNLAPYQGDESRKISWKHYARSGELVVKEGEELSQSEVKFELRPHTDEWHLSQLATQLVYCSERNIPFSLMTSKGPEHQLRKCLQELARC